MNEPMQIDRRNFVALMGAAFTATTLGYATPATAQIEQTPINEGRFVNINGVEQWVVIRGADIRNPVLFVLQGGPGIGAAFMAPVFFDWEREFTIVLWDQPGGGMTDMRNVNNPGEQTLDRYARDAIAVAEYIRKRTGQQKMVVFGNSWGTQLGMELIHRRPDMASAYVGVAQAVGVRGWLLGYKLALEGARSRGDGAAIKALEQAGPPPYASLEPFMVRQTYTNPPGQPATAAETAAAAAFNALVFAPPPPNASWVAPLPLPPGYDFGAVFMRTARAMVGVWQDMEIRDYDRRFDMPMFVFQGDNDINTPAILAREWIDEIEAPVKAFEYIAGASHNAMLFHAQVRTMFQRHVLPIAKNAGFLNPPVRL